ncbi:MAG: DUF4344 domain-containing metallopeptidase [Proteobacteria bacterium]|nr:DUF4344 domain-containing metallopeptidase [Pseudomonadota bacterium]
MFSRICMMLATLLAWQFAIPAEAQESDGGAGAAAQRIAIDKDSFVEGNLYFVAYHELGHALISEFDLAVVGREEDAVDGLATVLMTPDDDEDVAPDYLMGAIRGWFMFASETKLEQIAWWDEHGTSQQRAFQIACLLYGADAEAFKDAADVTGLPEERRQSCIRDSEQNETSWDALLEEDSYSDDAKAPDDAKASEVVYQATEKFQAEQDYLKQLGMLEDVAEFMRAGYKLKPGITLQAAECGQVNAFWDRGSRSLTVCYELVAAYQAMAAGLEASSEDESGSDGSSEDEGTSTDAEQEGQ